MENFLNVYGQLTWHDSVEIQGTKEGLLKLKKAIEQAIEEGSGQAKDFFDSDQEGYEVVVSQLSIEDFSTLNSPASAMLLFGCMSPDERAEAIERVTKSSIKSPDTDGDGDPLHKSK